ncbi:unnamed protein product [Cuscuta epithymum]|uniref:Neprosin PEP catalytic domain-containing protein n=1 Tax=Cuscuta epithymum TaxID=186058 RepID=A0AAV0CIT7_9ASTE|nr:unnamed protein product [Cuscuta epithymum]
MSQSSKKEEEQEHIPEPPCKHKYAVVHERGDEPDKIGIKATFNIWNPKVERDDLSISQMWIKNDLAEPVETLEAGWLVDPKAHPDTRFFIFFTNNNYVGKLGYDDCIPDTFEKNITGRKLGSSYLLVPVSQPDGPQYERTMEIKLVHKTNSTLF